MADVNRSLLKDMIEPSAVAPLFEAIASIEGSFGIEEALEDVFAADFGDLELKQRIRKVARVIRAHLPGDYREALAVLVEAAPRIQGAGFAAMALNDFVEEYGIEDFEASVAALAVFTRVVSAEFAVRPFLLTEPRRMLDVMLGWAGEVDPAVRRLATEGLRPRLPWGIGLPALAADPTATRPILEALRHDPDEAVRRSVANHLNDISKAHPEFVVGLLDEWQDGTSGIAEITRHGLRTLLKDGHPGALSLLGFTAGVDVEVRSLVVVPDPVPAGSSARAHWLLVNRDADPHRLMVDYRVSYHREGKPPASKVFKGPVVDLPAGQSLEQSRKLSFAQLSTRRIEPGPHRIEVQVNGEVRAARTFRVSAG